MVKKRLFENDIQAWYENDHDLALIVSGARQVSKTTSIINWSIDNKVNILTIDLFKEEEFIEIINNVKSVEELIKNISIIKIKISQIMMFCFWKKFKYIQTWCMRLGYL